MTLVLIVLKSGLLLGLAGLVRTLAGRASASTRRLILASAVVGALILPLLTLLLPAWGIWHPEPRLAVVAVVEEVLEPLEATPLPPAAAPAPSPESTPDVEAAGSTAPIPWWRSWRPSWAEILFSIWLLGALALLLRLAVGLIWTWRLRRSGEEIFDDEWTDALEAAAEDQGISPAALRLCLSSRARVPTAVGIIRAAICLPREAVEWTRARRRLVLLHELAHLRHGDNILNLLGQLLCAVYWFNPLAWWVVRRLEVESEHAADDAVLASGARPSDYAFELVRLARARQPGMAGASTMAEPSWLNVRVAWIIDGSRRRGALSFGQRLLFQTAGLAMVTLLSCVTVSDSADPAGPEARAGSGDSSTSSLALSVADFYDVSPDGIELTIDGSLQTIVDDEVRNLVDQYHPRSVSVVAIDPCNGHVLALGSHGAEGTREALRPREPGSTIKPITIASALEEGMSPEARFFCENGVWMVDGRPVRDAVASGWLDVGQIVARSSNIGVGLVYEDELGWNRLRGWLDRFELGGRPEVQIAGVQAGVLPADEDRSHLRGVMAANGIGLRASPLQVAAAYATLANGGVSHQPTLARRVRDAEGRTLWEHHARGRRVVSQDTARAVVGMLESAVMEDGTGRNARVEGLTIAGKTGTMALGDSDADGAVELYASFVGIVQPDDPQMVLLLGVEGVEGERSSGGQVAAPAFARIVSRAREVSTHID